MSEKLSKKELKALQFKAKSDPKAKEKLESYAALQQAKLDAALAATEEAESQKRKAEEEEASKPKKKRKTRRGKKGRGQSQQGFKATLFIGNIPKSCSEDEVREHFKSAEPFNLRMRLEKGFCFLELNAQGDGELDKKEIHRRTEICMLLHHTKLGNRQINVELSAGGGGNSDTRREKIQKKNEEMEKKRKKRIRKENEKKGLVDTKEKSDDKESGSLESDAMNGMNPERAALLSVSK
ncbi:Nop6 protein [Martiniozyma asiatica (nom. inval.)]|nr:Nop6 protein [Martiniozyma asiatica]